MICLEDGFAALDSTTTLPYSGQYDLGSEETIYTNGFRIRPMALC